LRKKDKEGGEGATKKKTRNPTVKTEEQRNEENEKTEGLERRRGGKRGTPDASATKMTRVPQRMTRVGAG